jgi:hypothetical protein
MEGLHEKRIEGANCQRRDLRGLVLRQHHVIDVDGVAVVIVGDAWMLVTIGGLRAVIVMADGLRPVVMVVAVVVRMTVLLMTVLMAVRSRERLGSLKCPGQQVAEVEVG